MEFPACVYKDGGPYPRKDGTYSVFTVSSDEELKTKLLEGCYAHPDDIANHASTATLAAIREVEEDNARVTREELKMKAASLELQFAPNVSDRKLRELIDAKLVELLKG